MNNASQLYTIAIVGINKESASLIAALSTSKEVKLVKVLNPEHEEISGLRNSPRLDIVIDTTGDEDVARRIGELRLDGVDIISGLSARILFDAGSDDGFPSLRSRERRQHILDSLNEVQRAVHVAKDKEQLLKMVLNISIESCMADSGSIMLIDPKKRLLRIEMADGLNEAIVETTTQKLSKGIAGTVVKTRTPLLINGPADGMRGGLVRQRNDVVSSMCCPLVVGEEVIGVININSKNRHRVFAEDDIDYLNRLTSFISDIIWASREYQSSARAAFFFSFVNNVQEILNLKYPFLERVNLVLMKIANGLGGEICRFYELNDEGTMFFVKASSRFDFNLLKGRAVRLNDDLTKKMLESDGQSCLTFSGARDGRNVWCIAKPVSIEGRLRLLLLLQIVSEKAGVAEESEVLDRVAEMIGKEYSNFLLKETAQVQSIKYSVINEVTFNLAVVPDLAGLARMVMTNARLIFDAKVCIMRLLERKSGTLRIVDVSAPGASVDREMFTALDDGVVRDVVTLRSVMHIEDIRRSKFASLCPRAHTALCACFLSRNRVVGTLSIYNKYAVTPHDSSHFSEYDKDLFSAFCMQVSKGIQRFL